MANAAISAGFGASNESIATTISDQCAKSCDPCYINGINAENGIVHDIACITDGTSRFSVRS